jgi:hypothetical protein
MPAHPTTVSLRSDAAEAPTTRSARSDCRKRSGPENATAEAFFHSAGGRNSQPPARSPTSGSRRVFSLGGFLHTIGTNAFA